MGLFVSIHLLIEVNMPRTKRKVTPKKKIQKKQTPIWEWVLIGIAVVASIVLLYNRFAPQPAELTVTVSQAAEKRDQGAFMLDVREPSEWEEFHMPGATLIPLAEQPDRQGYLAGCRVQECAKHVWWYERVALGGTADCNRTISTGFLLKGI